MKILLEIDEARFAYFESCARIRDITTTRLLGRLVEVIAADQLVLSVLDDGDRYRRRKGEHHFRPRRGGGGA